jgi:hypothetical protein
VVGVCLEPSLVVQEIKTFDFFLGAIVFEERHPLYVSYGQCVIMLIYTYSTRKKLKATYSLRLQKIMLVTSEGNSSGSCTTPTHPTLAEVFANMSLVLPMTYTDGEGAETI